MPTWKGYFLLLRSYGLCYCAIWQAVIDVWKQYTTSTFEVKKGKTCFNARTLNLTWGAGGGKSTAVLVMYPDAYYLIIIENPISVKSYFMICSNTSIITGRLCGLVVRVSGYRYRGLGFDSRRYQIFWLVVGLERGPLSLVSSIEELLE